MRFQVHTWVLDPEEKSAYRFDQDGLHPAGDELLAEGTEVSIGMGDVLAG